MKTMLILQGEDCDNESAEILVEVEGGKVFACDDFRSEIKIIRETSINGWGERLNGPAFEVSGIGGPGKTYVPQREWNRILQA
jgi:hypothetical protein